MLIAVFAVDESAAAAVCAAVMPQPSAALAMARKRRREAAGKVAGHGVGTLANVVQHAVAMSAATAEEQIDARFRQ